MHLQWTKSYSTSALHAAECLCRFGSQVHDEALRDKLGPSAERLGTCLQDLDSHSAPKLWDHLVILGSKINSNSLLANQLLSDHIEGFVEQNLSQRLVGSITEVEAAFKLLYPKYLDQFDYRIKPLQEQWIGFGNGFLAHLRRLTRCDCLVREATVVGVQPILGGAGFAHIEHQAVHIEAVLTNPLAELPEVVRLGWLVSQLHSVVFRSQVGLSPDLLRHVLPLAMLAPSLAAAEVLELSKCNESLAELAIENWNIAVPANRDIASDLIPMLMAWWETCLSNKPEWSVALKALAHRLGLHPI
ncbi:MAG: hypothetical protein ACKOAU_03320 [Pirellula sp.]